MKALDDFTDAIHPCHFEQSEKSKVGNRFAGNDFWIPACAGMTDTVGNGISQKTQSTSVILSEARNLKSETELRATI